MRAALVALPTQIERDQLAVVARPAFAANDRLARKRNAADAWVQHQEQYRRRQPESCDPQRDERGAQRRAVSEKSGGTEQDRQIAEQMQQHCQRKPTGKADVPPLPSQQGHRGEQTVDQADQEALVDEAAELVPGKRGRLWIAE